MVGRKLAARVLKSWVEDFVDEDTGEVVSIERNEVILDRETVLEAEHIEEIISSGAQSILVHHKEDSSSDYSIIFNTLQKDPCNSEKEAVLYIYRQLRNADPADDASAREVISNLFFSEKRYDLGEVGRYRINKKLGLSTDMDVRVLTREDIIEIIKYLVELINVAFRHLALVVCRVSVRVSRSVTCITLTMAACVLLSPRKALTSVLFPHCAFMQR